jgi:hypothetical protein
MARLPIDKLRAKTEKIENLISGAVDNWYKNNSREEIVRLLSAEFSKRLALCEEINSKAQKKAFYFGIERKEAETILKTVTGNLTIEEIPAENNYACISLETENVRVIVSLKNIIDYYLEEKREELTEALTGRDYMGDV